MLRAPGRRDAALTALALLALLAWDFSGADLWLTRQIADGAGFAWRDAWLTRHLLHDGGRLFAFGLLAVGLADVWWLSRRRGPSRAERAWWTAVVFVSLLAVPAIKQLSATSCPWDLAEFGGVAAYVPHWQLGLADGGPGHCFPSGHAVAAFVFFGLYFLWRGHRPRLARAWLAGTLLLGLAFGAAQVLRGAHYLSHVLWTAWICWALAAGASAAWRWNAGRPAAPRSAAPVHRGDVVGEDR